MTPEFWRGKRIFLTGHTGFKGSWMSLWLQMMGAHVTGYALPAPTHPSLFELARVGEKMHSIIGDIRDATALQAAMGKAQPDIVFHMAAQPLVRYGYTNPVETYSTNVMGTVHLLEAIRQTKSVRATVNITTDKCYENREWQWGYRENEALGGYDPYSSSKGCSELVTSAYRSSFFNPSTYKDHGVALASARAGNVIGGGDWAADRLIPDVLAAFTTACPAIVRHPHAIRPWQHVLEPLRGYLMLAQRLYTDGTQFAQAWNFGPNDDDARPVHWIVDTLAHLWESKTGWTLDNTIHPHEASYLKLDISKARALLHWHPTLPLHAALSLIVDWSKQYQAGADPQHITLAQIQTYQTLSTSTEYASQREDRPITAESYLST
ncbi:MAG: CDP-glucose 4,6-dehydratase [Ottowia sp.]|nr:CDP-glucose 4,6-dehydratase [Ottowia sp.]